jgi:hypothetical protein
MWTYCILGILAIILMVISFRWYNLLLSFFGALGWLALWAYNLANPPTGVVVGSFVHTILIYTYIGLAIVSMLVYFRNRGQSNGSFNAGSEKEGLRIISNVPRSRGVMDLSVDEYKQLLKAKRQSRK